MAHGNVEKAVKAVEKFFKTTAIGQY